MLYTSETRAGALLEFLAHAQKPVVPLPLGLIALQIPSSLKVERIDVASLPDNWRDSPPPQQLAALGSEWAIAKRCLALRVPSVLVPHEDNLLLNPLHADFKKIIAMEPEELPLDRRLLSPAM